MCSNPELSTPLHFTNRLLLAKSPLCKNEGRKLDAMERKGNDKKGTTEIHKTKSSMQWVDGE